MYTQNVESTLIIISRRTTKYLQTARFSASRKSLKVYFRDIQHWKLLYQNLVVYIPADIVCVLGCFLFNSNLHNTGNLQSSVFCKLDFQEFFHVMTFL